MNDALDEFIVENVAKVALTRAFAIGLEKCPGGKDKLVFASSMAAKAGKRAGIAARKSIEKETAGNERPND